MNKSQLKNYINLRKEVNQIEERLKEYEFKIGSVKSQIITGLPSAHGSTQNSNEAVVLSFVDLEREYIHKLAKLNTEIMQIETAISLLNDSAERQVMRARYIEGKKWEEICDIIGYSWSQTLRIHARALEKITEKEN